MLASGWPESREVGAKAGDDDIGGHPARDLSSAVSAHAVGERDDSDPSVDCEPVLVVLANVADVGEANRLDGVMRHDPRISSIVRLRQRLAHPCERTES